MPKAQVCLSPDLIHRYNIKEKVVVIVDILRATSCITTGIAHGVNSIVPVADLSACAAWVAKKFLCCGERNGEKVAGFDMGNSPYEFMGKKIVKRDIVMTTTNGTQAIKLSEKSSKVIIGSFLNLQAVTDYLIELRQDLLIFCAGWKGTLSIEDTLFAGALSQKIAHIFDTSCDATLLATTVYKQAKRNLHEYILHSSHAKRLSKNNNNLKDLAFCTKVNLFDVVPILQDGKIIKQQPIKD